MPLEEMGEVADRRYCDIVKGSGLYVEFSTMPALRNEHHELFAQACTAGKSASEAYRSAGYKCAPHKARGHGHRLRPREDVAARIQELVDKPHNRIAMPQIVEAMRTGRPTTYRPELAALARKLALLGATEAEMRTFSTSTRAPLGIGAPASRVL
jgi:hypothetical protein